MVSSGPFPGFHPGDGPRSYCGPSIARPAEYGLVSYGRVVAGASGGYCVGRLFCGYASEQDARL